jgi:hypothetical protein
MQQVFVLLKKIFGSSEPVFSIHRGFVVLSTKSAPPLLFLSSFFLCLVVASCCLLMLLVFLLSLLVFDQQLPCCLLKLWLQTTRKGLHCLPPLQSLKGLPRPLPLPLPKRALERNRLQSLCHLLAFLHQSEPQFRLEQRSYSTSSQSKETLVRL